MAWVTVMCPDGPYAMNVEGVARLIRAYAYARALDEESEIVSEPQGSPWDYLPDITLLKTDWSAVKKQRDIIYQHTGDDFYNRLAWGMKGKEAITYLQDLLEIRNDATNSVTDRQRQATKTTMRTIAGHVKSGEAGLATSTFIAKAAAETELALVAGVVLVGAAGFPLALGATSVGTAAAVGIGTGSALKGGIKWAESERLGEGIIEGSVELMINSITYATGGTLQGKAQKILIGLAFGFLKKSLKDLPVYAYRNAEDVASGNKKTLTELWTGIAAGTPSGIVGEIVKSFSRDVRFVIPATVVMKLLANWGAKEAQNAAAERQKLKQAAGQPGQRNERAVLGKAALHHLRSSPLADCAKPNDDFVNLWAMRPLASMP